MPTDNRKTQPIAPPKAEFSLVQLNIFFVKAGDEENDSCADDRFWLLPFDETHEEVNVPSPKDGEDESVFNERTGLYEVYPIYRCKKDNAFIDFEPVNFGRGGGLLWEAVRKDGHEGVFGPWRNVLREMVEVEIARQAEDAKPEVQSATFMGVTFPVASTTFPGPYLAEYERSLHLVTLWKGVKFFPIPVAVGAVSADEGKSSCPNDEPEEGYDVRLIGVADLDTIAKAIADKKGREVVFPTKPEKVMDHITRDVFRVVINPKKFTALEELVGPYAFDNLEENVGRIKHARVICDPKVSLGLMRLEYY